MIAAIDPGSKATAYAFLSENGEQLLGSGLVTAPKSLPLRRRVRKISEQLLARIRPFHVSTVVVETPATKSHWKAKAGQGLASYGLAVGYLIRELETQHDPDHVHWAPVEEWQAHWKRGARPLSKGRRAAHIAALYHPDYDPAGDPGHDIADAIAIGRWFATTHFLGNLRSSCSH